jgi:hypothetical protein
MESLLFFATLVSVLVFLASRFGVDSRDGNDWVKHPKV